MEMIKELFNYTGINIKKEHWNTYDEMNKIIIFIDLRDKYKAEKIGDGDYDDEYDDVYDYWKMPCTNAA